MAVFQVVSTLLFGLPALSQAFFAADSLPDLSWIKHVETLPRTNGPKIMKQFTSNATFQGSGPQTFPATNGTLVYDAISREYSMVALMEYPFFDHYHMNMTRHAVNDTMNMAFSEGCVNFTMPGMAFSSLFEIFTYYGQYNGTSEVLGQPCELWALKGTTLCMDGDKPLQLKSDSMNVTMLDFKPEVDRTLFKTPEACKSVPPPCGDGEIINQTVYVAHPPNLYNISGQDVADSKGDAVFLCLDSFMAGKGGYQLLSAFELSIVRNFSQYTNYPPPGVHGFGGDGFHVGREAPLFTGTHWGQCEDDAYWHHRIGQWFSLPPHGQCTKGKMQLGRDCTWRIERRIATVEMKCLLEDRNFTSKCTGAVAPFLEVEQTLLNAIASEDSTEGGCPRVREPECRVHKACSHLAGDCCPGVDGSMMSCCTENAEEAIFQSLLV